ncbi:amidase family protein [Paecilomyces variotii No. 5]|uniref:Amidase family protein n=1 Tax=Byssochlamys spectabilis (strain No. 5 / NBRC 109023) TaxID=1356009 RepID=V5HWR3_BYSSN|nr:amidase family protein [Paecilomyces variotii No. 5]
MNELTISRFRSALLSGVTTCEAVTKFYLSRILTYDKTLRAIITTNPEALEEARRKDAMLSARASGTLDADLPPLHGVPIILKDTYATASMPTTAGSISLRSLRTNEDAHVVQRLRAAGAIILAKANLHEFSLQGITVSSLGGQTLNPYDRTRTPGGSSGGTAAALAANMGLVGCGGDTMNSLRSPASACGVVGFRPSRGQISKRGTVPVTMAQDTLGPMARTVEDVRILFEIMRGPDVEDQITLDERRKYDTTSTSSNAKTTSHINPVRHGGKIRIGVLGNYFDSDGTNDPEIYILNETIQSALEKSYSFAELIHLSVPEFDTNALLSTVDVQSYEFRTAIDSFLQSRIIIPESTPHRSLASIAASGEYMHEAMTPPFFESLQTDVFNTSSLGYLERLQRIETLKKKLGECFEENELGALVYPHQRRLVVRVGEKAQSGRNGILAALTGTPAVCIPAGFSPPTETAPLGVPIGIEFLGRPWKDFALLDIAERFEGVLQARREPALTMD